MKYYLDTLGTYFGPYESLDSVRKKAIELYKTGKYKKKIFGIRTNKSNYGGNYGYIFDVRGDKDYWPHSFVYCLSNQSKYWAVNLDGTLALRII